MKSIRTMHIEAPVAEAIETLSSIADLELAAVLHDPSMASEPQKEPSVVVDTVRWLHQKNAEHIRAVVQEKLHVLLRYFEQAYESNRGQAALKGMRTIMLLVDEAAENLDRYIQLFLGAQQRSMKETKEFRELCSFYTEKIEPRSAKEAKIGALPMAEILTQGGVQRPGWARQMSLTPLTLELEEIQRDIDYELLFLKKEDGGRFFTPRLIRSMKLACDIEQAVDWQGKAERPREVERLRQCAVADGVRTILNDAGPSIDAFFHYAHRSMTHQPVMDCYAPCIALLEASIQAVHQSERPRAKSITEYFNDFRSLLSAAMRSADVKRVLSYPPPNEHSWEYALSHMSERLSSSLVLGTPLSTDLIRSCIGYANWGNIKAEEEVGPQDGTLSRWLAIQYASLRRLMGATAHAALARALEELEVRQNYRFEPLIDGGLPHRLCDLALGGGVIPVVQLPSPTRQERIDKAVPTEVFLAALRHIVSKMGPVLIINLQDRTAWRDGARCQAIEGLGEGVSALSIPKDGEWYRQEGERPLPVKQFKEALVEHALGEAVGWPRGVVIPKEPLRRLVDALHEAIYGDRNSPNMRRELIDLVHIFLILRAIEETKPACLLVCCKDGLDITGTAIGGLFSFLKFFNRRPFSEEERDWLGTVMLGLTLIERERLLFPDRFNRAVNLIKVLESASSGGAFMNPVLLRRAKEFLPHESASAVLLPSIERHG